MAITKEDLDTYVAITNKLYGEVVELGKYYMELHGLDEKYLHVAPGDDYRGFCIEYNDDYEVRDSFEWSRADILDPEKIKESMRYKKELDEKIAKDKLVKTESAKIDYEKAEYERLKQKYGNQLPS